MTDYILIQNRNAKVNLLATRSCRYCIPIRKNYTEEHDAVNEAILVASLYIGNRHAVAASLRERLPDVTTDEIDKYCEKLKKDHPLERIYFSWRDIPLFADSRSYFEISLPWLYKFPIQLTVEQERELLSIVQDNDDNKEERMTQWFRNYREKYGIETKLKRNQAVQDTELMEVFCVAHGFSVSAMSEKNTTYRRRERDHNWFTEGLWLWVSGIVLLCGYVLMDPKPKGGIWLLIFCLFLPFVGTGILIDGFLRNHKSRNEDMVAGLKTTGIIVGFTILALGLVCGSIASIDWAWNSGSWILLFLSFILLGGILGVIISFVKRLINQ